MLKLNIGCGSDVREDHLNYDIQNLSGVQIVCDITKTGTGQADESVDEIYASHFIEHLSYEDAKQFLAECKRVLKSGGKLILEFPSLKSMCEAYLKGLNENNQILQYSAIWSLYGETHNPAELHKWGWDTHQLAKMLHTLGFSDVDEFHEDLKFYAAENRMVVGNSKVEAIK